MMQKTIQKTIHFYPPRSPPGVALSTSVVRTIAGHLLTEGLCSRPHNRGFHEEFHVSSQLNKYPVN